MPVVAPDKLAELQRSSEDIRNICILAHVDHGKTSLTDALIATNGIISPKLAGKIRYLDSRPDEQLRGITMESSAISLSFSMARRPSPDAPPRQRDYLINLIDSPGHVDFSSEVSTASRLCDGALVLVDAVEGVCSQTVTVLRQTWLERMRPLLVVNKIDRLVWELKMTPGEAYTHLSRLVEEVNAVLGSFFQGERMEEDLQWRERMEERRAAAAAKEQNRAADGKGASDTASVTTDATNETGDGEFEERDDEDLYFAPENNNIIFCSATDGWAFTVRQFAHLYEKKIGVKRSVLEKVLWGDYYLDPKTKKVLGSKHLKGRALKPMFVQLVLENIWAIYESTTGGGKDRADPALLEKITKSLNLTIPQHVKRSKDSRALLTAVFSQWLPLSTAVLVSVIEHLPSPPVAQAERLPQLIENSPGGKRVAKDIREAMCGFKTGEDDPVVAFISKMVSVPESELPENKRKAGGALSADEAREMARKKRAEAAKARAVAEAQSNGVDDLTTALSSAGIQGGTLEEEEKKEDPEHLIGFARLYSGVLKVGDSVYVLPPKFSPAHPHVTPEPKKVTVTALYLLMGRSLEALSSVPAGAVFGIGGLEGHVLKSATLCSQLKGAVNLAGVASAMGGQPIVRVALEPADPRDLGKMIAGLKLLEQSDPCAQYEALESGEHVVLTAGELHLERCLKDLRERFARCEIQAGEPIVPYRETIISTAEMNPPKNKDLPRGTVIGVTSSKQVTLRLRVRPLPEAVTAFLIKHARSIRRLYVKQKEAEGAGVSSADQSAATSEAEDAENEPIVETSSRILTLADLKKGLRMALKGAKDQEMWFQAVDRIVAFGPRRVGPNILVDITRAKLCKRFGQAGHNSQAEEGENPDAPQPSDFSDRISHAFQLSTAQGPLCHEPTQGTAVFLEEVEVKPPSHAEGEEGGSHADMMGRLTGEVIKITRDAIRQGFLDWSPRLMLAMYSCEIQASTDVLGRVYAVINRRGGRILSESLHEGTPFFTITALLPLQTSFGFGDDIRKRTAGLAAPQLRFHGFDILDEDPFWVPTTEEEIEDLGEKGDRENMAKKWVDGVRKRKGMLVTGGVRLGGEKARTLKK